MDTVTYADFNATTPLCPEAKSAMIEAMEYWGNPSSSHSMGRQATRYMEEARMSVAAAVGALAEDVVFTSGGSEANTLALLGHFFNPDLKTSYLSSKIEHASVKNTLGFIEKHGGIVDYVKILNSGNIDLDHFAKCLIEKKPKLVSLMAANNETGLVLPIDKIARQCHEVGALLHTDAVQGLGKVDSGLWKEADLISISAHKIHGPKGVGALIIRNGMQLVPTHFGGSQEFKRRGGTQNVIGIIGFGAACRSLPKNQADIGFLRDEMEKTLLSRLESIQIQAVKEARLPNTSNIRFPGVSAQVLLGALDIDGICVSSGSACSSGSISPSHVLLEMGLSNEEAKECIRISFSRNTTKEDVERLSGRVIYHVERILKRRKESLRT